MYNVYLTAIAAISYLPLLITLVLDVRARKSRFACQTFNDDLRALGGQVTTSAFVLFLPALFLIFYDSVLFADLPWDEEETVLLIALWLAQYPLTLFFFHMIKARIRKTDPYARRYSAIANIVTDMIKHSFLTFFLFTALFASDYTLRFDHFYTVKDAVEKIVREKILGQEEEKEEIYGGIWPE